MHELLPDPMASSWENKNRQPRRETRPNVPVCPYYPTIELAAELTGTEPDELRKIEKFCGHKIDHPGKLFDNNHYRPSSNLL
jgi:hypothetical protein